MKTIIEAPNDGVLSLGRQGENLARRIAFKLPPDWDTSDPAASVQLVAQRAEESTAYPVMLSCEDGVYYWDVTATDTGRDGYGLCELRYLLGDVLAKSMTWITSVAESISEDLTDPPDAAQNYLSQVMAEGARASAAADRAESTVLKMPYIENGIWMVWDFEQQAYVNTGVSAGGGGGEGTPGAVFTPHLADNGDLSWTNSGGLDNPETVNIMGPQGPQGIRGETGPQGPQGSPGSNGKTAYQYAQDGGYTGPEMEFAAKLAAEHLPVPAAAAVGQYFKAKAVDENGRVKEVEAVDAPTNVSTEDWVQIVDLTVEDTVQSITNSWAETPMKKIRVLIETVAHSKNTDYMPTIVCTALDANIYFHSAQFYPTALPLTEARHTEYLVAMMKVGEYNAIRFTEYLGGIRGVSSEEKNIFKLEAENSAVSTGNNPYGESLLDYITAFKVSTYEQFEAGTKLKIWGVPA